MKIVGPEKVCHSFNAVKILKGALTKKKKKKKKKKGLRDGVSLKKRGICSIKSTTHTIGREQRKKNGTPLQNQCSVLDNLQWENWKPHIFPQRPPFKLSMNLRGVSRSDS